MMSIEGALALAFPGTITFSSWLVSGPINEEANIEEETARTQELQNQYKQTEYRINQMESMRKQLAYQRAANYNRGLAGDSPSFSAIQINTINTGSKRLQESVEAQKIGKLSFNEKINAINAQRNNSILQSYMGGFIQSSQMASTLAMVL